jgi:hypothetical protein
MVQQADVRLNHRDHVVDSVHLHPTLAALERHGADDHAVGQLVNDRLVLNYDRIDGAVAEVLIGAPQRPVPTKIAQSKTRSGRLPR